MVGGEGGGECTSSSPADKPVARRVQPSSRCILAKYCKNAQRRSTVTSNRMCCEPSLGPLVADTLLLTERTATAV